MFPLIQSGNKSGEQSDSEINDGIDVRSNPEESVITKKKFLTSEKGFIKNVDLYDLDSSQEIEMTNIRNEMDK